MSREDTAQNSAKAQGSKRDGCDVCCLYCGALLGLCFKSFAQHVLLGGFWVSRDSAGSKKARRFIKALASSVLPLVISYPPYKAVPMKLRADAKLVVFLLNLVGTEHELSAENVRDFSSLSTRQVPGWPGYLIVLIPY